MTEHEIRHGTRIAAERDALADTFPASDAPFWTLGERAAEFTLDSLILERDRIALLIRRDGLSAIVKWVRRTMHVYRRAVLDKSGFARTPLYSWQYIVSYCDFKRWLEAVGDRSQ